MILKCAWCGRKFETKTKRAQFCSNKCRQAHHRAKISRVNLPDGAVERKRTHVDLTDAQIAQAVLQVRGGIATFDAASVEGPKDKRFMCRELAEKLNGVLVEVGL